MISIESDDNTVYVRIPRHEFSEKALERLLRNLRLEAAVAGNPLTEEAANAMAEEMKADWWARNEARFIPPEFRDAK